MTEMYVQGDHSQDTEIPQHFPDSCGTLRMLSVAHIMAWCMYCSVICSG